MLFSLTVTYNRKRFHLQVEQLTTGKEASLEVFKVYPKENPSKFVLLQSNRPVLLLHRLKHKAIAWKVLQGQLHNPKALEAILEALEAYLAK